MDVWNEYVDWEEQEFVWIDGVAKLASLTFKRMKVRELVDMWQKKASDLGCENWTLKQRIEDLEKSKGSVER